MERRTFLAAIPLWSAALAHRPRILPFHPLPALAGLGVQLYTVRDRMAQSVSDTLARIAAIGYREVEFAGLFGTPAREMAALLGDLGLSAPSTHIDLGRLGDGLDAALDEAEVLGHRWLVCPYTPVELRTADGYRGLADRFNAVGSAARARGLAFAYHNHDFEFADLGAGETGLGILLERGEPGLVSIQLDLFWAAHAGQDPLAWFAAHPGRFASVHAKDRTAQGDMVAVGDGMLDFATLIAAGTTAGVEHVFVEHDQPDDSLESVSRSYRYLAGLDIVGAPHDLRHSTA